MYIELIHIVYFHIPFIYDLCHFKFSSGKKDRCLLYQILLQTNWSFQRDFPEVLGGHHIHTVVLL